MRSSFWTVVAVMLLGGAMAPAAAVETAFPGSSLTAWFGPERAGVLSSAVGFSLRAGAWLPQTRSNTKLDKPGESRVNYNSLSVDPQSALPEIDFNITILRTHKLRVGYWSSTQEGKTTLSNAITFNGTVFPSTTPVKSNVDLSVVKLGYEWMVVDGEWLRLGVGLGADLISTQEQIKQTGGGLAAKQNDNLVVPFFSGEAAMMFGGVEIFATMDLIHYGSAYLFDGRAGISYGYDFPPGVSAFTVGLGVDWRIWDVMVDNNDLNAEWTQQGLEIFAFFKF